MIAEVTGLSETTFSTEVKREKNILEYSRLHKVMELFHLPAEWAVWQVGLGSAALVGGVALIWLPLRGWPAAFSVAVILGLAIVGDAFLLWLLPRWRLSFGPWKSQLFVLAAPRAATALLLVGPAFWWGDGWALGLLAVGQLAGTAALIWGAFIEPFRLQLTHLTIQSDRMPAGSPPIRCLQISDLHLERLTRRESRLLELARQANPDFIVITGDYLNLSYVEDAQAQAEARRLLRQLSAPYGVYAILGSPTVDRADIAPALFEGLPIRLLRDERLSLEVGEKGRLTLLGLTCSHQIPIDAQRLERLVQAAPDDRPQILLYHSPDLMPQAAGCALDLYLCGHTHGGQVRLPLFGALLTSSHLGKRYEMGHYQEGRTHLYVSRGVGLEGLSAPRVRFLAPPEITLITLTPPDSKL